MNNLFTNIIIITIVIYYCYLIIKVDEIQKGDNKDEAKPIIILYNFIKDEYITFLDIESFYRAILSRGDKGAMIEYYRKHHDEQSKYNEVKFLIECYYKNYEIKKLDI